MLKLIRAEFRKIKWPLVIILILIDVVGSFMLAASSVVAYSHFFEPNWQTLYFQAVLYHGQLILPLYIGVFAAFLSFYEHNQGAWRQMLTLPFPRWKIYMSKFWTLMILLGGVQLSFLASYVVTGFAASVEGMIPWRTILIGVTGGWLASFPLAMLQLSLSTRLRSFGAALMLSIFMAIPNMVIVGFVSTIGAWIPTAPPYYAMFPSGLAMSPRVDVIPFILIVCVTFIVYAMVGCRSFVRRDWL